MRKTAYDKPEYYDIAFSFFDSKKQIDNFEKIINKFSKRKVKRFLDIACGQSPQLLELARRGYDTVGLDLSAAMLKYLKNKGKEDGSKIETLKADMNKFRIKKKVDFAFIMMGSLIVESNERFLSHLDSVSNSLNKGGLYFIQNWGFVGEPNKVNWTIRKNGITVKTMFETKETNPVTQAWTEQLTHIVNDHGKKMKFIHKRDMKFIYPQEFKTLVNMHGKFEFLGWYEGTVDNWYLNKPMEKAKKIDLNMILLRKK